MTYSFPSLEPVHCSMSNSNCCFLSCIQVFQDISQVVWYSHLFKNFPVVLIYTVKVFRVVNESEYEVKWALGSITTNKASGGDGIPAELFQILKDDSVKALHSICQQIWKTQQWPQDWKRPVFIAVPKKGSAKECSNYCTIALISHTSKVIFKILQAQLQQ